MEYETSQLVMHGEVDTCPAYLIVHPISTTKRDQNKNKDTTTIHNFFPCGQIYRMNFVESFGTWGAGDEDNE